MKKIFFYIFSIIAIALFFTKKVLAVCPICAIAVAGGVGFSRWLRIDDVITGLWIGGLIVSLIIWTENWFDKKNIQFKMRFATVILGYYLLTIVPLYFTGILGNPQNSLLCFCNFRLDKLLLGIIIGSIGFYCSAVWYLFLKEKNNHRAFFPYQKVVMPVSLLIILSIIFYFLTSPR